MLNVTIIGFGNVGSALAVLLLNNKQSLCLNIMEPNEKCEGAFLDLFHSMSLYQEKELVINNDAQFQNADFIFHTAGTPNVNGSSRLSMTQQNCDLTRSIFENITFKKVPIILVITNPVDIVSYTIYNCTGIPAENIIGTGTFLDSIRLNYYLSSISNYKVADFDAIVLGEHGSSQFPVYSHTNLNGKRILESSSFSHEKLELAKKLTIDAAFEIRKTQAGTLYGVSKCAVTLFDYIHDKKEHFLALSMLTNEHYRKLLNLEHPIYISMPVLLKGGKFEIVNDFELSPEELEAYRKSAALITENMKFEVE